MMNETFKSRVEYIRKCCKAAQVSVKVHRYNYEPTIVDFRACTFDNEVFGARKYLSWVQRVSMQELKAFAQQYLQ